METKKCPLCGIVKNTKEYHSYFSKERQKYRIGNYCKPCARENSNKRAFVYYKNKKDERLQYAKNYRSNPDNKEKLKTIAQRFKKKYREELKDCYVRDRLNQDNNIPVEISNALPEIVEAKRIQLKIRRKIKQLRDGKK